jgi:hypothetical protein
MPPQASASKDQRLMISQRMQAPLMATQIGLEVLTQ